MTTTSHLPKTTDRTPRLPPRWFIVLAWKIHRAIFRLSGGRRGLWPARAEQWGTTRVTTVARRSGQERPVIFGYFEDGSTLETMAMNGWGAAEPVWWLNLQSNPHAQVQLAEENRRVVAHAATDDERAALWSRWRSLDSNLDGFARRRPNETAVVVLLAPDASPLA
jgi:deazaflavin-dependent oxidoreductase (nitroreductase family)